MAPDGGGSPRTQRMSRPEAHRTISQALRIAREREEQETLMGDDENAEPESCLTRAHSFHDNPHANLLVYKTIHRCVGAVAIPSVDMKSDKV